MKQEYRFKTNINCGACIARVTPFLDKVEGIRRWDVDISSTDKILTVESDSATRQDIINAVKKVGFTIEDLPSR